MRLDINWDLVDLTRPRKQLADELGVHENTIKYRRFKQSIVAPKGRPQATDWSLVDFSKSDDVLAKELGVHRTTVTKQRARR